MIHDTSPVLRHSVQQSHNKGLYYGFRDAILSRLVTLIKHLVHHAVYCISLSCLLSFLCNQSILFKYLGVLLSHDLSWGEHVQSVCSKARKILGLLYRRFYNNAPSNSLVQLYLSLVRPHLDYASAIWSPHVKKDKIALENVQKFACRMATRSWDSSYQDVLDFVDLPSLECRRLETRLCLLYKIIYKLCYFDDGIITPLTHHALHNIVLNRPFARTNSNFYSFVPYTISLWNNLDSSFVCAPSVSAFKNNLQLSSLM